ncbi:MAG: DnaJ C-terminal domain-containing protein [Actinomycetales bacterium]
MASQDWLNKDFYALLGVPKDASDAEIKKAYRKLAKSLHPDRSPDDKAAETRFKEVGEAYSVLSDPEQRKQYDAIRSMTSGGARFTSAGRGGGAGGFEDVFSSMFGGAGGAGPNVRFSTGGGAGGASLEDLLGGMFGGGAGGGFGAPRGPRRGADVEAATRLGFRQAVTGETVQLHSSEGRTITVRIPAGVKDGQRIRLPGKGRPGDDGAPAGDMVVTVQVEPHPVFGRDGDNLTITVPVTFAEAALGTTLEVPTLDGATVKVKLPPGTPSGRVLRVKGRGVRPKGRAQGDLLVKVEVVVPQRLSDDARNAVEAFQKATAGQNPRADLLARAKES